MADNDNGGHGIKVLRNEAQISLWLDYYKEIFSDFDPSPFSQRRLSDDFLFEAKRAARETSKGTIELKLLVPQNKRDLSTESVIRKRLRGHFKRMHEVLEREKNSVLKQGFFFIGLGIAFMLVTTFVLYDVKGSFILTFLAVLGEPAGWFLFWEGLNLVIFEPKRRKPDLEFNRKMSRADVSFISY